MFEQFKKCENIFAEAWDYVFIVHCTVLHSCLCVYIVYVVAVVFRFITRSMFHILVNDIRCDYIILIVILSSILSFNCLLFTV